MPCDAVPEPADLDAIRKDPKIQVLEQPGLNVGYLAYNTTKKPFDDVRVRKAINMAINKKAIIDAVYLTTGVAAKNPIPPTQWSYNDAIKDDPFDPAAAKKLLADAGYPNGFETDLWAMPVQRPYNPNARRIAELMQADLAKVGVKAEIKSFEWGEYRKRMRNGEHQMGMLGWTGDNGDPDNFLNTLLGCDSAKTNGSNVAKFCYQPFEELVTKGQDHVGTGGAHPTLRKGAGDLQGTGPLVHDCARGAAQADEQERRRFQAVAVRTAQLLRRRHQGITSRGRASACDGPASPARCFSADAATNCGRQRRLTRYISRRCQHGARRHAISCPGMLAFIIRRLLQAVLVMLAVALVTFLLFQYFGDPVSQMVGQDVAPETVFPWPGTGLLFIQSMQFADIPVTAAYLCLIALVFVLINLMVDLLYFAVDPRLRIDRAVTAH